MAVGLKALFLASLLAGAYLGTHAQEADSDERESSFDRVRRDLDVDVEGLEIEIEGRVAGAANGTSDSIGFSARLFNGDEDQLLSFEVEYESEADSGEIDIELQVDVVSIIEFNETNGVEGYQRGEDAVLSTYASTTWNVWQDNSDPAMTFFEFESTSTDGVVTVRFYVTSDSAGINDAVVINANSAKFDLEINNYPYESAADEQVFLAVVVQLQSDVESEFDDGREDDEEEEEEEGAGNEEEEEEDDDEDDITVSVAGFDLVAQFDWETIVDADGANASIIMTVDPTNARTYYYTVNATRPINVVWDPELIVTDPTVAVAPVPTTTPGNSAMTFGFSTLSAIAGLFVLAF